MDLFDCLCLAQVFEDVNVIYAEPILVLKVSFDIVRNTFYSITEIRIFVLCKTVEFSPSKDEGLQDSRLVVNILQLEWSDSLCFD